MNMPFCRDALILSRMRSAVTSRSNWAKLSRMLSVSRPIEVVVLNDWVTETKVTPGAVEHLDELREVHQRARQPVDLVDHDDVDQPLLDVGEQPLQRRALQRAAGEAAVVVGLADQRPALGALAGDVGLAGLALGVQRVELLLQPLLARLAGVDRAAELAGDRLRHAALPWRLRPKNTRPFQRVPVMARAIAESER